MDSYRTHVHQANSRVEFLAREWKSRQVEPDDILIAQEQDDEDIGDPFAKPGKTKKDQWQDFGLLKLMAKMPR